MCGGLLQICSMSFGTSCSARKSSKASVVRLCLFLLGVLCLAFLSGCAKMPLYADLDEKEANQIAAALMEKGVVCSKLPGKEGTWILEVSEEDFAYSMNILNALELPRQKFQRMSDIFPKGTFSSPSEDHFRFVDVREQQLSDAILSNFPAVMSVHVNLSLPLSDPLSDTTIPATASVILKHRPDFDFEMVESDLKSVVANSVVGLTTDDVKVLGIPAEFIMPQLRPAPIGGVSAGLSSIPPLLLAGISSAAGAMLVGLTVWLVRRRAAAAIKA